MPIRYVKSRFIGEIDDNYMEGTLVDNTALTITITVPSNEIWFLHYGRVYNGDNVTRTVEIYIENETGKRLVPLIAAVGVSAGGEKVFPNNVANSNTVNQTIFIVKGGWKIKFYFAAGGDSSGGTAEVTALVEKFKVG